MTSSISIPTVEELRTRLNTNFTLALADGPSGQVVAELVAVDDGIAMNARYQCYIAEFALPVGVNASQETYVVSPCGQNGAKDGGGENISATATTGAIAPCWHFMLSPTLPDESGRGRLHAVFHVLTGSVATGQTPAALEDCRI